MMPIRQANADNKQQVRRSPAPNVKALRRWHSYSVAVIPTSDTAC
jgi:hypothetical protein